MRPTPSALAALLVSTTSLAAADATDGVFIVASEHATQVPRSLPVPNPRGATYLVPGARLTPSRVSIAARDNANTLYDVDARYVRTTRGGSCERGLLRLGARTYLALGWGGDDQECSLHFELDPSEAQRAAALFHTTRQDRHPIGEHVVGVFTLAPPASSGATSPSPGAQISSGPASRGRASRAPGAIPRYAVGEPIEVVLTLTSPAGSPPVAWQRGGENRGPRDDQFDFVLTRDGQPVAPIEAMNFGGLSFMDELVASDHDEARTPLAPWADVTQPGHYEVTCSFHTVFAPAGVSPFEPTTRGQAWDRTFTGTVSFDVVTRPSP